MFAVRGSHPFIHKIKILTVLNWEDWMGEKRGMRRREHLQAQQPTAAMAYSSHSLQQLKSLHSSHSLQQP